MGRSVRPAKNEVHRKLKLCLNLKSYNIRFKILFVNREEKRLFTGPVIEKRYSCPCA